MIRTITIKERGPVPRTMRKAHTAASKAAWLRVAENWQARIRPKHFTEAGAREYHYTRRKGELQSGHRFRRSYTGRKLREKGHTDPLVYSGRSRERSRQARLSATARGGAKVSINAPTLNLKHPKSRIVMRAELAAISDRDAEDSAKVFDRSYGRRMKAAGGTTTKTI